MEDKENYDINASKKLISQLFEIEDKCKHILLEIEENCNTLCSIVEYYPKDRLTQLSNIFKKFNMEDLLQTKNGDTKKVCTLIDNYYSNVQTNFKDLDMLNNIVKVILNNINIPPNVKYMTDKYRDELDNLQLNIPKFLIRNLDMKLLINEVKNLSILQYNIEHILQTETDVEKYRLDYENIKNSTDSRVFNELHSKLKVHIQENVMYKLVNNIKQNLFN